jgi:hypothetical protein
MENSKETQLTSGAETPKNFATQKDEKDGATKSGRCCPLLSSPLFSSSFCATERFASCCCCCKEQRQQKEGEDDPIIEDYELETIAITDEETVFHGYFSSTKRVDSSS